MNMIVVIENFLNTCSEYKSDPNYREVGTTLLFFYNWNPHLYISIRSPDAIRDLDSPGGHPPAVLEDVLLLPALGVLVRDLEHFAEVLSKVVRCGSWQGRII